MIKSLALAVVILVSGMLASPAEAGGVLTGADKVDKGQTLQGAKTGKNGEAAGEKSGYSVDQQYKKRVANKKRAAEMRQKLMKQGKH